MGNQCAQNCSADHCTGSEARFDLDSEHAPSVNQQHALSDYPRVGLKPTGGHDSDGSEKISFAAKQSPKPEYAARSAEVPQFVQAIRSAEVPQFGEAVAPNSNVPNQKVSSPGVAAPNPPKLELGNQSSEANTQQSQPSNPVVETADVVAIASGTVREATAFLEMVFEVNGQDKVMHFYRRPLGAEFSKRRTGPTQISKVHAKSYASELGVAPGWVVKTVAGEDVRKRTFEHTQKAITNGLMTLPHAGGAK
jgi:hypothetical protein